MNAGSEFSIHSEKQLNLQKRSSEYKESAFAKMAMNDDHGITSVNNLSILGKLGVPTKPKRVIDLKQLDDPRGTYLDL